MPSYDYSRLRQPDVPYAAFSGSNIFATIKNRKIATLQAITYSVTREVAALYSFSDPNPKTFVKGKRGIAGTLVFTQFDRHAILQEVFRESYNAPLSQDNALFTSRLGGINSEAVLNEPSYRTRNFAHNVGKAAETVHGQVGDDIKQQLTTIYDLVAQQRLRYADQIPEFDVTLTFVNEAGDSAFMVIQGIVLVNEGGGYTLDDLTSETAYTYVARSIVPLTSLTERKQFDVGSKSSGISRI